VETKLARDYYNELCSKIEEHEQLKKNYFQLESKLGCLQELADLRDELAHTSVDLASAQKALVSYKDRAESVERYKEKVADLEAKMMDYEQISVQLDDARLVGFPVIKLGLIEDNLYYMCSALGKTNNFKLVKNN